jgi:hypothetical protein
MAKRALELRIERKGRRQDTLEITADPADTIGLRRLLTDWLEGEGWDRGLWPQFSMTIFAAGSWKKLGRVKP